MIEKDKKPSQSQKILNAAYECISTRGYASVSLRDIADAAGVTLSQLTYYYKSKEGLVLEVIKRVTERYLIELEAKLSSGESAQEKLQILTKYYKESFQEDQAIMRMIFDFISLSLWSKPFGELFKQLFIDASKMIENHILSETKVSVAFRDHTPEALSRLILAGIMGVSIQTLFDVDDKAIPLSLEIIEKVLF